MLTKQAGKALGDMLEANIVLRELDVSSNYRQTSEDAEEAMMERTHHGGNRVTETGSKRNGTERRQGFGDKFKIGAERDAWCIMLDTLTYAGS
jgi:hypothetical protein